MGLQERAAVFSVVAAVAYTLAFYFDWGLVHYYPEIGEWHVTGTQQEASFAILWYGWLGTALLAGLIASIAIPKRVAARFLPDLVWLVPAVLLVAVLVYEKRWFL